MVELKPIRVLCIAHGCSLQDGEDEVCLTARYEYVIKNFAKDQIILGVAYMFDNVHEDILSVDGVEYYAVHGKMDVGVSRDDWDVSRRELLRIIEIFKPDIIHCFGAEWPCGLIAKDTEIPVVIHMMGYLHSYYESMEIAFGKSVVPEFKRGLLSRVVRRVLTPGVMRREEKLKSQARAVVAHINRSLEIESEVMRSNSYFMGRTLWDRSIVRYYSPDSNYYHVSEAVKNEIYSSAGKWKFTRSGKLRLFSLSLADDRKGNEIILRTARLLKELLHIDFEWIVAGGVDFFPNYEKRCGIKHDEVNIKLIGRIGTSRIIDELQTATLSVHPSLIDNSPHSVCEAQLIGCPVIASNVGGVPQLIEDGVTGFLFPYNEPHTLAFLIAEIWKDETRLTRVSNQEVAVSLKRHDPKTIANDLLTDYRIIIGNNSNNV